MRKTTKQCRGKKLRAKLSKPWRKLCRQQRVGHYIKGYNTITKFKAVAKNFQRYRDAVYDFDQIAAEVHIDVIKVGEIVRKPKMYLLRDADKWFNEIMGEAKQ